MPSCTCMQNVLSNWRSCFIFPFITPGNPIICTQSECLWCGSWAGCWNKTICWNKYAALCYLLIFLFVCPETSFYFSVDMRSIYKDLVWLMNKNSLISSDVLKRKVSIEFCSCISVIFVWCPLKWKLGILCYWLHIVKVKLSCIGVHVKGKVKLCLYVP